MKKTENGYASYLLRLWQADDNGEMLWRVSLESSQTGQKWVFANLDELMAFLRKQTFERTKGQVND
ncbi:MAG: hypothetical protein KC419_05100 [Anaerolineales bacterium]|nr:hypothetical protein [Anaerolineales bacterium]